MRILSIALVLLALSPAAALCQSPPTPRHRRDISASIGGFMADHPVSRYRTWSTWSGGLFKGVAGGYYWTDHLKTEVEVAATGETDADGDFTLSTYSYDHFYYRDVLVSAAQVYQFGRNRLFHPFVSAGLDIDREETEHTVFGYVPVTVTTERTDTAVRARPFAAAGFKAYFSERVFFRMDTKAGFRNRLDQVTWKIGFGVDF